jgi:hypothetical protein
VFFLTFLVVKKAPQGTLRRTQVTQGYSFNLQN